MRIVILGPPGSGKGSQARRLAVHYQLPYITVQGALGDIAAEDSELGRLVRETMEANRVSDELMLAVLRVRLGQGDVAKGFVLDGFPRMSTQADTLDLMLEGLGRPVDVVMLIDVDPDDLMERLVGRLTCEGCGTLYNLYTNPPTVDGVCDRCGGRVSRRPDDYEETISNRLRIFESQTAAVIEHYKLRGKLRRVAGGGEAEAVFTQIRHIVDATPRTVIEMEPVAEAAVPLPETEAALLMSARKKVGARRAPAAPPPEVPAALSPVAKPARAKAAKPLGTPAPAAGKPEKPTAPPVAVQKPAAAVVAVKAPAAKAPVAKMPATGKRPSTPKTTPKAASEKAAPAKKAAAGQAPAAKPAAKAAAAKAKPAPNKPVKKPAPTKPVTAKAPARKAAGKVPAKPPVAKKKAAVKKAPARKAPAGKPAAKTGAAPKARPVAKKPVTKKAVAKKAPARKPARVAPRAAARSRGGKR